MRELRHRRRAFRKALVEATHHLNFNLLNLSGSGRITLVGVFINLIALFIPWLEITSDATRINATAFSAMAGYIGWITLPILAGLTFLILSTRRKEAFKSRLSIPFYDYTVVFFGGLTSFLLAVIVFNMGIGFARTVGGAIHINVALSGITFQMVGALLVMMGGFLNYREKKRELLHMIYLENLAQKETDLESYAQLLGQQPATAADRSNMSLPV